jgi:hypothetical protein
MQPSACIVGTHKIEDVFHHLGRKSIETFSLSRRHSVNGVLWRLTRTKVECNLEIQES